MLVVKLWEQVFVLQTWVRYSYQCLYLLTSEQIDSSWFDSSGGEGMSSVCAVFWFGSTLAFYKVNNIKYEIEITSSCCISFTMFYLLNTGVTSTCDEVLSLWFISTSTSEDEGRSVACVDLRWCTSSLFYSQKFDYDIEILNSWLIEISELKFISLMAILIWNETVSALFAPTCSSEHKGRVCSSWHKGRVKICELPLLISASRSCKKINKECLWFV